MQEGTQTQEPTTSAPPPATTGDVPRGPRASFFRRLGAALLDGILLGIVGGIVAAIVGDALGQALSLVLAIAYFTYFEGGETGQTLGKKALGIRVIDQESGGPIGYGRGLIRYIGRYLSAIPLFLGYFWMIWDDQSQTWHDKLASDVVVPEDAYPVNRS